MKKLVLIDGHSILNRAFYGVPELTNSSGIHTNAVYGFLNIMFKIIDEEQPDNLVVAFDVKQPTFRHIMYKEYKGTRKPMPMELREQVPLIKEVLQSMDIKIVELPGYEADDIIGTLAKKAEQDQYMVSVITGDRDLLQLATKKILIRIPKTKKGATEVENYYEQDVKEKYQVSPIEFIDVKALMGDTADNIKGVPSVGEKTATSLIVQYKNIENIYEHIEEITKKKIKESLIEFKEQALLSKKLVTININSPIEIDYSQTGIDNMFNQSAYEKMKNLEFKSILNRFVQVNTNTLEEISCDIIEDFTKAVNVFDNALGKNTIGLNFIYEKKDWNLYQIFGISIAVENQVSVILTGGFITEDFLIGKVKELFIKEELTICLIDLKEHLKIIGDDTNNYTNIFDCEIAGYLLNPLKDSYNYDDIARDYLGQAVMSREELLGKKNNSSAIKEAYEEFIKWAYYSSKIPLEALNILEEKLKETNQIDLFNNVELPLIYSLNRMEKVGIKVEKEQLKELSEKLSKKISILEKEIYIGADCEFNINSPKQLGEVLFVKLQLPGGKKTKTGYSTSADILDKLAPEYDIVSKVLEYRQLTKLKSTYADGLTNYIYTDGRIHGKFNQTITATGRISSTEPNLQNIPIRMDLGREIRRIFVPKEGCKFVDADYSQIELRVLAHMANDESLIEAYKSNEDIHRITASKVFHTPFEEVTNEQRSNAKAVNFGIVYGISSFGLSQDLNISKKEAGIYIEEYFKTYPQIKAFLDKLVFEGKEKGFVTTLFGRRRPIPELNSANFMQRSFGERIAMNSPIQGTAADIIKIAMINVDRSLRELGLKSKIVLQVHDELLIEAYEEEISIVKDIVEKNMQQVANLQVPLEIGIGIGDNWLEAH